MTLAGASVRRLRVATSGTAGVPAARALVADALNTREAAAGGGLLVLRRLDAGPAAGPGARGRVAARIGRELAAAGLRAVPASARGAAAADAVRFRDLEQAYGLCASCLLAGGAEPWFVQAILGHRPGAPRIGRFRALLLQAAAEPAAQVLVATILAAAAGQTRVVPILADLEPSTRATLLAVLTAMPPEDALRQDAPPAATDPGRIAAILARAPAGLRAEARAALADTRSREIASILAAACLVAARPGLISARTLQLAERVLRVPDAVAPGETIRPDHAARPSGTGAAPSHDRAPDATFAPARVADGATRPAPSEAKDTAEPAAAPPPEAGEYPSPPDAPDHHPSPLGTPTRFAGAVLAVALLEDAAGALLASPQAAEAELGRQALAALLRGAGAGEAEAALAVFGPDGLALPLAGPLSFRLPASRAFHRPVVRRLAGHSGWRVLSGRRGPAILACWKGRMPPDLRALTTGRGAPVAWSEAALVRMLELAARASARRLTGTTLRALLRRPGWIAADRTHLEVTMPAGAITLGVRRAGLDLDPGWCPWLARVVTIRYDYGGPDA